MTLIEIAHILDRSNELEQPRELAALRGDVLARWPGDPAARTLARLLVERIARLRSAN